MLGEGGGGENLGASFKGVLFKISENLPILLLWESLSLDLNRVYFILSEIFR